MDSLLARVSQNIYRGYIRGGRLWPQKRGGINISIMSALSKSNDLNSGFQQLVNSSFSTKQIHATWKMMVTDHTHAGITIPVDETSALLHLEWTKSQGGVCKTFLMFFGIDSLALDAQQDVKNYIRGHYIASITQMLSDPANKARFEGLRQMAQASSLVLEKHQELAALFRLTYYTPTALMEIYQPNQAQLEQTAGSYNITASLLHAPREHRSQCLERMEALLQDELSNLFPGYPHNWITWGFSH